MIQIPAAIVAVVKAPIVAKIAFPAATTAATTAARLLTQKGVNRMGSRSSRNRSGDEDPEEREARLSLLKAQMQAAEAEKLAAEQAAAADRARRTRDLVWTCVTIIVGVGVLGALAIWAL